MFHCIMKFKEGFIHIINSKSKKFLGLCFCFLGGVAYASLNEHTFSKWYLLSVCVVLVVSAIVWKSSKPTRFIVYSILFILLGIFRYQVAFPENSGEHIHSYAGNKMRFSGFVSSEPDVRLDGVRYRVRVKSFLDNNKKIQGEVYLRSGLYPRYDYGDELEIACEIEEPKAIEDTETGTNFRYDRYLSRMNIYAICSNPEIKTTERNIGNPFFRVIFSFKSLLGEHIADIWHEPYASFVAGLLYGYRGGLGSLNELFSITGVTHIVAISGYNITIIATIFIGLCKALYIPRKKAFYVIVIGIAVFVLFAGASASVVRAGVMGIVTLIAKQSGRASSIGNVLIVTAVCMCLQNPFVLVWDAGFQLSFVATLGLVYLSPVIEHWFVKIPNKFGLQENITSTISAIVATLPLILFQFGRLSIVAPFVNVLILWIIPWVMIVCALSVVLSFITLAMGRIGGIVGYLGMEYSIRVVKFFAGFPYASVQMRIPWYGMIMAYLGLLFFILKARKKIKI